LAAGARRVVGRGRPRSPSAGRRSRPGQRSARTRALQVIRCFPEPPRRPARPMARPRSEPPGRAGQATRMPGRRQGSAARSDMRVAAAQPVRELAAVHPSPVAMLAPVAPVAPVAPSPPVAPARRTLSSVPMARRAPVRQRARGRRPRRGPEVPPAPATRAPLTRSSREQTAAMRVNRPTANEERMRRGARRAR
jgi:hypothetical protein